MTSQLQFNSSSVAAILKLILTLIIGLLILNLCFAPYQIQGNSMWPTLQPGQYILVSKIDYWQYDRNWWQTWSGQEVLPDQQFAFTGPQHGDLVVIKAPFGQTEDYIKRVVALPGDHLKISQGRVYLNDQIVNEPYVKAIPNYDLSLQVVPAGTIFVLGDNRPISYDSHTWGYLPYSAIIGKVVIRYYPNPVFLRANL